MSDNSLNRLQLLTAEIFSYSFAHFADHVGIGNVRFDKLMPDDAQKLETAVKENWNLSRTANELGVDADTAAALLTNTRNAINIVDAPNPAIGFREAISQLVLDAAEKGLNSEDDVAHLVTQICYRVSDLRFLLMADKSELKTYCKDFRDETYN